MNPDPVFVQIAATVVALIFATGAAYKLRDLMAFEMAIEAYELIPPSLSRPVAWLLPMVEAVSALGLLFAPTRAPAAVLALGLLAMVSVAIAVNLVRRRYDVGCGCGGLEDEQTLSWALLVRNAVLMLITASVLWSGPSRAAHWLDYLTVTAGALACYVLYVLTNQLIANRPRLQRLRAHA